LKAVHDMFLAARRVGDASRTEEALAQCTRIAPSDMADYYRTCAAELKLRT
jgi:hypothetical protein